MPSSVMVGSRIRDPSSAKIQIYTFGTLQVVRDTIAVTESDWHTRQARQLLKILLTERPRPVSTDLLIELLWPSSTPNAAATTLRSAINALRNVLEPERPNRAPSKYIVTQAPGYAFHLVSDIWLDVEEFENRLNVAQSATDRNNQLASLEAAIELYKDDYLISDPYADWLLNERERLRERFFNALLIVAEIYADGGHYADAIPACRRMLARDEVRENAYQALMRYQAESGDSAGALLTYERCRTILLDELGADPSPLTQTLHQRILNGEIEPRATTVTGLTSAPSHVVDGAHYATLQSRPKLPQRTLLPVLDMSAAPAFIGRSAELAKLEAHLDQTIAGIGSLIVLEGEAGMGKTRLAYHALQRAVAQEATVISGACQSLERELPFAPLADSLGRYIFGLPDQALQSMPQSSLVQLTQIIPSLQDRMPFLPVPTIETTGSADENRGRLIEGILAFLMATAAQRPLVLFLDDLQWADLNTLAVLGRLTARLKELPLFLLLAYRSEDLPENDAVATYLHTLNRNYPGNVLHVTRFDQMDVVEFVKQETGIDEAASAKLADLLYAKTNGNPLFVSEALRDVEERLHDSDPGHRGLSALIREDDEVLHKLVQLPKNQRLQEIVMERVGRLPENALSILRLCAVIGRDFSLDLLETAAKVDLLEAVSTLLQRRFLVERSDDRLDFNHQLVRETIYDSLNTLQRRTYHLAVADALVALDQNRQNPAETAFHYSQAGGNYRLMAVQYGVLAGEKTLRAFGFRQAVEIFDRTLETLDSAPETSPEFVRRALQGRGLAYESLFDPEGVTSTYRKLQAWALQHGDRKLTVATYSRLVTMLGLLGQQYESNVQLEELLRALAPAGSTHAHSRVLTDLLHRRQLIYSPDALDDDDSWAMYTPAPPPVSEPAEDLLNILEPVHAVLPLFDYGWVLLVQGQLGEATRVLETVVDLATSTSQPSIASAAYHQLAVTARILGDLEQSQMLNEESIAINRTVQGAASELASMWPRISSGFLSLQAGRLDEAERRLQRVADFLGDRPSFSNYRNSANIGLGLVALARGQIEPAHFLLREALIDPVHLYPYTHVQALLGMARIAELKGRIDHRDELLRLAIRFAGRRSLLEEYIVVVLEVARFEPAHAPLEQLLKSVLSYVHSIGLEAGEQILEAQLNRLH